MKSSLGILTVAGLMMGGIWVLGNDLSRDGVQGTPTKTQGYIISSENVTAAASNVRSVGGHVTHELPIIRSVGARLTSTQASALRSTEGVTRVWLDQEVATVGADLSVEDDFSDGRFDNNDAANSWSSPWREESESNGAERGDLRIKNGYLQIKDSDQAISRVVDLASARSAEVAIRYRRKSFDDAGDYVDLEIINNDGVSTRLARFAGPATDSDWQEARFPLQDLGPQRTIRLSSSTRLGTRDKFRIDSISVEWTVDNDDPDLSTSARYAGGGSTSNWASFMDNGILTHYPSMIHADKLHDRGLDGSGVRIAVIDTGLWVMSASVTEGSEGRRDIAYYDAVNDTPNSSIRTDDWNGHGTHVISVIARSRRAESDLGEQFNGIAPNAPLLVIRALDQNGRGSYADVIRAIQYVVDTKDKLNTRVLNLSLSGSVQSYYWDDPLNRAVMEAWRQGIVVVVSAGNAGPEPMSIGVPANVPYVISVGAVTDSYTPNDDTDDELATFSSAGPTAEGFVKPEIVAPGGHLLGLMSPVSVLARKYPEFHDQEWYFTMSGTSQAAAVVSGAVALLLQDQPWLSPDDVKCRLMATARSAIDEQGDRRYAVFQTGAGLIDINAATSGTQLSCANRGIDIDADLEGAQHFGGPVNQDSDGKFGIMDGDESFIDEPGLIWDGGFAWSRGYMWKQGFAWSRGFAWNQGFAWSRSFTWCDGDLEIDGYAWRRSLPFDELESEGFAWNAGDTTMESNQWVDQE